MYDRYRVHVWKVNTWRSLRNETILKIFPHSSKTLLSFCCTMWKIFTSHSVQLAHTKMFYYLLYFLYWYAEYCIYLALSHMLHLVYVEAKNLKVARSNKFRRKTICEHCDFGGGGDFHFLLYCAHYDDLWVPTKPRNILVCVWFKNWNGCSIWMCWNVLTFSHMIDCLIIIYSDVSSITQHMLCQ